MNGYDSYLESRILSADPVELVRIIYQAAVDSLKEARSHLAADRIKERSIAVTRAVQLLAELSASLNHEVGGELSQNLARLYDYMQRRLLEANAQQAEEPLVEVLGLLSDLQDAWKTIGNLGERPAATEREKADPARNGENLSAETAPQAASPVNPWTVGNSPEPLSDYATHTWSL